MLLCRYFLTLNFPLKWTGKGSPFTSPSCSPDFSTPLEDLFFWGYLKDAILHSIIAHCARTGWEDMNCCLEICGLNLNADLLYARPLIVPSLNIFKVVNVGPRLQESIGPTAI